MTGTDLLQEAVAELYSSAPHEFISRRAALAASARAAGEAPTAKKIAALRKPTQSAWVVNQLARSVPAAAEQLAELGAELRAAQRSLDGEAIRELSARRRELVDDLTRQALAITGQRSPAAALRDEVTATLGAALADPEVGDQLAAGVLERAVVAAGFGSAAPALTLIASPPAESRAPAERRKPSQSRKTADPRAPAGGPGAPAKPAPAKPAPAKPAPAKPAPQREAVAAARHAAAEADHAAEAATRAEHDLEATVGQLEENLADARQQLAEARIQARRARARQRQARLAAERLGAPPRLFPGRKIGPS